MIRKHLWPRFSGEWTAQETRMCQKCGAVVTYVKQPRCISRLFETVTHIPHRNVVVGAMQPCEPPEPKL